MKNILIVDDDNIMIRLLSTALRNAGYATYVSFDVVQAATAIRRHRIDAVLLDMRMPGGTGKDVIRRLKMSNQTKQIPVIVVSGSVSGASRAQLIAIGAEDLFLKPPDMRALLARLAEVLERCDMQDAAAGALAGQQTRSVMLVAPTEYFGA
jgi:DNA-binding response OmpR family regulator